MKELYSPVKAGLVAVIKQFDLKNLYFFALNVRNIPQRESLIYDEMNLILSKTSSAQLINYCDSAFSSLSQRHSSTFTILISTGKVIRVRPVPEYTK